MLEELDSFIVGERAAHKAESPARQLAAWLAGVWEGARDDIEPDTAVEGDHLVSFLDDGALDVLGTGTVRSLAATAADDAQVAPAAPGPPGPAPATAAAPIAATAAGTPVARPAEPAVRPGRISSSTATVASGSFLTIPAPGDAAAAARSSSTKRRGRRQISPLVSIVFVGVAAGAVVFFIMNGYRERERTIADLPGSDLPGATPPRATPPRTDRPDRAPPEVPAPVPGPGRQGPARPASGSQSVEPPHVGPPHTGQPHTGLPHTGLPHAGHEDAAAAPGHTGSGAAPAGAGPVPARPASCRVRINLTPWAYYTADDDTTRYETPSTIELAPGRHRLHVWNPELHVERDITITVPDDRETMNYSEPLKPSTLPPGARPPTP
jgi:hypothetical protein